MTSSLLIPISLRESRSCGGYDEQISISPFKLRARTVGESASAVT
jgi:hypothetical protein